MERGGGFDYFNQAAKTEQGQGESLPSDLEKKEADYSLKNLDKVLGEGPGDKLVPFSGKIEGVGKKEQESAAEKEDPDLAELSEMWRDYLNLTSKEERDRIFKIIKKAESEIIRETGAKNIFFGFGGDISLIYEDGRNEKIFENPGLAAVKKDQAEVFSDNLEAAGGRSEERKYKAEDFNIPGPFTDVAAAKFFSKSSDYLDLSAVPFCSKEVLRALQPRTGLINLLGLEPGKIDNEALSILKSFAGKALLKDDIKKRIDEI